MSDSDSETENFCFFGQPLAPYDEDTFPKRKPTPIEEQVATDAQGRRRFHGAFTGGFSAGFYNTVGSLEGWAPAEFKSTRGDKAARAAQRPEDFMDEEDCGEFGIAPQRVRATEAYAARAAGKRPRAGGAAPGALEALLRAGNETVGHLLLRNIGLKGAQPVGDGGRVYGCEMPQIYEISRHETIKVTIDPIYQTFLTKPKDNTFGLGYQGLDKSVLGLFQPKQLIVREKGKTKVAFTGQAFGVGAFEDEDDDIYVKDDMSRYDFELTNEKGRKLQQKSKTNLQLDSFVPAKVKLATNPIFPPPTIPHSFTGKHKVKKSRFEPVEPEPDRHIERKEMNPAIRARYLGEEAPEPEVQTQESVQKVEQEVAAPSSSGFDKYGLILDRFVMATKAEDQTNILEAVAAMESEHGTEEMRSAVKMKMFGPLTRISCDWQPCSLLCRRFNVPEPLAELSASKARKRTKNLIFEYEQHPEVVPLPAGLTEQKLQEPVSEENQIIEATETLMETSIEIIEATLAEPTVIDMTDKINVEKNIDLFKAVFLSSDDESESEPETDERKEVENSKEQQLKESVLGDGLLPQIRPTKAGILSGVDFSNVLPVDGDVQVVEKVEIDPNLYGPSLPQVKSSTKSKVVEVRSESDDEWVEKSTERKKGSSHGKSHRKDKKKSKKSSHKKKHKRKKE